MLPIKDEYGGAELMVDRKTLTDAEKNRIVSLKPSDIKTDGVTRYADISESKIAVFDGEDSRLAEAKSIAEDGTRTFDIGGEEVELPPVYAGLAVTYSETTSLADFDAKSAKYWGMVEPRIKKIAGAINVEYDAGKAIGGWTFTDADGAKVSGEPSYSLRFAKYGSYDDVKLLASVLADTTYESQDSVMVYRYVPRTEANGVEYRMPLSKVDDGLMDIIKEHHDGGFTLQPEDKTLILLVENGSKDPQPLLDALTEGGYSDGTRQQTKQTVFLEFLDRRARREIESGWLQLRRGQRGGGNGGLLQQPQEHNLQQQVEEALQVNDYLLARYDANGHLPDGQTRNARDILTMASPEFRSFKANLSDAVDDSHALKLLNLSKRKYYEGLANAKMAKQLTNSDIDALSTMAERNLTSVEIEATDIYKYAKKYADGSGNDVQVRYGEGVYNDSASVIVEAANAKDGETYALSRARKMVDDVDEYVRKTASEDAEVSASLKKAGVEIGKLGKGEGAGNRIWGSENRLKRSPCDRTSVDFGKPKRGRAKKTRRNLYAFLIEMPHKITKSIHHFREKPIKSKEKFSIIKNDASGICL